ncbi:MAG TPA: hypothetical protein VIG69_15405 [Candidatus Methylomirabilis sp.]
MRGGPISCRLALAALLAAACAPFAGAAEAPPSARPPTREEFLREIRRLEGEVRDLQSQMDLLRGALPGQASAVVTVPAGARQGNRFNAPAPEFGPSDWVPTWPPVVNPSPQSRQRTPVELGAEPPPPEAPFDFPQFVPGSLVVRHGLGPSEVTVSLALLNADGSENLQVNPNRIAVRGPKPPDGTFTILNYTEYAVTVRWVAQRPAP